MRRSWVIERMCAVSAGEKEMNCGVRMVRILRVSARSVNVAEKMHVIFVDFDRIIRTDLECVQNCTLSLRSFYSALVFAFDWRGPL